MCLIAIVVVIVTALPGRAAVYVHEESAEEVAQWQSAGIESAFFGPPLPASGLGNSVALQPLFGGRGPEALLAGMSAVWHTSRLLPWHAGVSVGALDSDFTTWSIAVSSGREVWRNGRSAIAIEGAVGYQFFVQDDDNYTAISFGDEDFETGEETIVESFRLLHGMAHAVYSLELGYFVPVLDLGFTATGYRAEGYAWDESFPVTEGESRDESSATGSLSLGIGASLIGRSGFLFVGLKGSQGVGFFQANVGVRF